MAESRARCEIFALGAGQGYGKTADVEKQGAFEFAEVLCNRRRKYASRWASWQFSALIVVQLILLAGFARTEAFSTLDVPGAGQRRSLLQIANPNCKEFYTVVPGDICGSLITKSGLSIAQLREINPSLNCKELAPGQAICVRGISDHCQRSITITPGPATSATTCAGLISANHFSREGFFILNPGLSCPSPNTGNSWTREETICVLPGLGRIFMEYMGASGNPITFDDIQPLVQANTDVVYHVILAYANDVSRNGTFRPQWSPSLDAMSALEFKADNPQVKILVSIGGASKNQSTINGTWADPADPEQWITNAEASLTDIADEYNIDGLDISYEQVFTAPNGTNFAYCIGTLIDRLKGNNTIDLATIAPFENTLMEYSALMNRSGDSIDYVNYQFYRYRLLSLESYYLGFNNVGKFFVPWKLLASTEVSGNTTFTGSTFQTAVTTLGRDRGLPGVMLWSADTSLPVNFAEEKGILSLLNGVPYEIPPVPGLSPAPAPVSS